MLADTRAPPETGVGAGNQVANIRTAMFNDSKDMAMAVTPPDPLLSVREAAPLLGISASTFFRRVADGTFPPPVKLDHLARWPRSELLAAIERLKAERAGEPQ